MCSERIFAEEDEIQTYYGCSFNKTKKPQERHCDHVICKQCQHQAEASTQLFDMLAVNKGSDFNKQVLNEILINSKAVNSRSNHETKMIDFSETMFSIAVERFELELDMMIEMVN